MNEKNDQTQSDSLSASGTPLIGKLTPRLLRTLSSETNLQTITLGGTAETDSLATMSLAEIGGIPQIGTTAPLDPNLLIGLSPETLSMMSTASFQFLPTMSTQNDLSIGTNNHPSSSVSALDPMTITKSSSARDTLTTCVTRTHPITSCLTSYTSNCIRIRKGSKSLDCVPVHLEGTEGICNDHSVVTIIDNSIVEQSSVAAGIHCDPNDVDNQEVSPNNDRTMSLFESTDLESSSQTLNENNVGASELGDETDGQVGAYLAENQPETSKEGLSQVVTIGSMNRAATRKQLCTSHSLINLSNTVEAVSENCPPSVMAASHNSDECLQGQRTLLSASENSVQYVSITVPNVEINSSGQLVISHISLLQTPHSSSYIPLVTQSVETPVISQIVTPDSTSEGLPPKLMRRKGGWPKGKKRKVNPFQAAHVPKGPTTSYMIFFRENRQKLQEENPSLSFKELLKVISLKWAGITKDERKKYKEKAAKQKKRYLSEVKTHAQTEAYQILIRKETEKKLACPDADFAAGDVFLMGDLALMEEDPLNPNELYCKVCNQYFSNIHNKKEHLSGKQHIKTVGEKLYTYAQQQPIEGQEPVSVVTLDDSMKNDLTNVDGIRVDIMELHAEREIEIKNLRREATITVIRNAQLNKELKDLQDTCEKLQSDLKNLKSIDASLQTKLNSLRILMTLFGVLNLN